MAALVSALLLAGDEGRFTVMVRSFLVALVVMAPVAWVVVRRTRARYAPEPPEGMSAGAVEGGVQEATRDTTNRGEHPSSLASLVAEIGLWEGDEHTVTIGDEARRTHGATPGVVERVVEDSLRRSGWRVVERRPAVGGVQWRCVRGSEAREVRGGREGPV